MHFVEPIRDERCLYLSNYVCTKVLYWLSCVGYTKLRWGVVHAEHVGLPMKRARWFMLGIRPDADVGKLEKLAHSVSSWLIGGILKALGGSSRTTPDSSGRTTPDNSGQLRRL